jgi:hypothetical protein
MEHKNLMDLSGKKFNKLQVIDISHRSKRVVFWNCICECGTKLKIRSQHIRTGHTKSCGCIQKYKSLKDALKKKTKWNGECLEWIGCCTGAGYGMFCHKGKNYLAHRASYTLYKGKIPGKMFVCHICDNRKCTNPNHLFLGTQKDNVQDMIKKKRHGNQYMRRLKHEN